MAEAEPPAGWSASPLALLEASYVAGSEFPDFVPGTLSLRARPAWARIQVLRRHDLRADRPEVYLGRSGWWSGTLGPHRHFRADPQGRIAVLAASENPVAVLAKEGETLVEKGLLRTKEKDWHPIDLILKPAHYVSGRVLDARDAPVPGAWVDTSEVGRGLPGFPLERLLPANQDRTGADGGFKLYFPARHHVWLGAAIYDRQGRLFTTTPPSFELEGLPVTGLVLRFAEEYEGGR